MNCVYAAAGFFLWWGNTRYNYQLWRNWYGLGNTIWLADGMCIIGALHLVSIRGKNIAVTSDSITAVRNGLDRAEAQLPSGWVLTYGRATNFRRLLADPLSRVPDYSARMEQQLKLQNAEAQPEGAVKTAPQVAKTRTDKRRRMQQQGTHAIHTRPPYPDG